MNGQSAQPLLSVGFAVYNGERFLRAALDSILHQTLTDFELIISDNASTDGTQEICREYAARDPRIRYSRNATNIGGANNENYTVTLARGRYFRWAAHDDVCQPTLFERCVGVLERDPEVVLCHSQIVEIDEHDAVIGMIDRNKASDRRPSDRFRSLLTFDHNCEETYGIIRTEVLRRTKLQQNYTDSDRTLLCELSLYGRFFQVPEPLFHRRLHPAMSTKVFTNWRERMLWFDPGFRERIVMPHWMQFIDYLRVIARVPITAGERARCYTALIPWLTVQHHGRWMAKDVVVASLRLIRRWAGGNGTSSQTTG